MGVVLLSGVSMLDALPIHWSLRNTALFTKSTISESHTKFKDTRFIQHWLQLQVGDRKVALGPNTQRVRLVLVLQGSTAENRDKP